MKCDEFVLPCFVEDMIEIDSLRLNYLKDGNPPLAEYILHYSTCADCKKRVSDFSEHEIESDVRGYLERGLGVAIKLSEEL